MVFADPSGIRWAAGIALEGADGQAWPPEAWTLRTEEEAGGEDRHGPFRERRQHFRAEGWTAVRQWRVYADGATAVRLSVYREAGPPLALRRMAVLTGPLEAPFPLASWRFYQNGFHSWSFAGATAAAAADPRTRLGPWGAPMVFDVATPPGPPGLRRSDLVAALVLGPRALIVGQLTTADQFVKILLDGRRGPRLEVMAELDGLPIAPGEEIASEWIWVEAREASDSDPFGPYAAAVARAMGARGRLLAPAGWCSWYFYETRVRAEDVLENLAALARRRDRLPVALIQIDDGFQAAVGDWLRPSLRFPEGVAPLAQAIRDAGFTPGLWLAPFLAWPEAPVARSHPEWLLRDEGGRPVSAGYNWYRWLRALDPTHPGVTDWLREVIHTVVHRWGFPYLKLDFLYAAALPGRRHDPRSTRAQALRRGLQAIREAAGEEAFLLGCGCPLGPAIGLVDGMRIGPDVAPHWAPRLFGLSRPFRQEPSLPAARNAVRNILTRAWMHRRWWWNDPDCLILRDRATRLTEEEVCLLVTAVAISGGMVLDSDPVAWLPEDRLGLWAACLPPHGLRPEILDLLERPFPQVVRLRGALGGEPLIWIAFLNGEDRPLVRTWPLAALGAPDPAQGFAFWSGETQVLQRAWTVRLPPHGAALWALRPARPGVRWWGSTLRIPPGLEVTTAVEAERAGRWTIALGRRAQGAVWLALPGSRPWVRWEGQPLDPEPVGPGIWRVTLTVQEGGLLEAGFETS